MKSGWCWTGVTVDMDLLGSEMENKGPFVGMQGPSEKGKMPNKKTAGKRAPAKRKLAEVFAVGEVLADTSRKEWKLGVPIGQGGFGRLYLADVNSSKSVGSDAPYVAKVKEFVYRNDYQNTSGKWQIFIASNRSKKFAIDFSKGMFYRFMIMDRFGRDLQKMYEENAKQFSHKTVLQLGLRILDILEYVHEHEYVHGDIKAANLLLSYKNPNQVYLVDYGLAYRYCPEGVHKAYKEDPKRCHDGTIEYTSIDAHKGVAPSRRGDLEILGYCMVHWLSGHLPWEDNLKDPDFVRDSKISSLLEHADSSGFLFTECGSQGLTAAASRKGLAIRIENAEAIISI
ncbi:Serine/threonine-protein kinase VRK1 [Turdus rufiventris]|nr:Serine/threonine-protein kinase VRK1 [Turdus rufiventris]